MMNYRQVYVRNHPFLPKGVYLEHRLVMANKLGRALRKNEEAHHINGNRLDNRPDNLRVMTRKAHRRFHQVGRKGPSPSPETRKRISDSLKASPSNTQRLRALAKAQRGKHLSKAHREKIGNSLRGKPMSEERKHRLSLAKMGHSVSKETRRKISKSKLGRKLGPCSEEHKRRISESRMGHLVSEETRQKLKLAWKVKAAKKCSPK